MAYVKLTKLPNMKRGTCRCRVIHISASRKTNWGEDCTCDFKPERGKIRSFKTKEMNFWEMKDAWDIRMGPEYYKELAEA